MDIYDYINSNLENDLRKQGRVARISGIGREDEIVLCETEAEPLEYQIEKMIHDLELEYTNTYFVIKILEE